MADRLIRTYRFRLKPTSAQHNRLREALEHSRQLYNAALEERIDCYRKTGRGRSLANQCRGLTELRADPVFGSYSVSMQRGPLVTVDRAYKAFFSRGGFPRFKGRDRFKTISWSDRKGWAVSSDRLYAKGLGRIPFRCHRPIEGRQLTIRVKREGRHWFLSIQCEIEKSPLAPTGAVAGIDLGLSSFAALSDGSIIANPRHARRAQHEMRRRQRALARCKRGSRNRRKARSRLSEMHRIVRQSRRTHHFQIASVLMRRFDMIAVEDLNVKGLSRSIFARDVHDAGWGSFLQILSDKAESAGRQVVKVDPRYTSQTCPECGTVKPKALSERVHACDCGYTADRDVAAARIILDRAVRGPGGGNAGGLRRAFSRKGGGVNASTIAPQQWRRTNHLATRTPGGAA